MFVANPLGAEPASRLDREIEIYSQLKSLYDGARQLRAASVADGSDIPDWAWHLVVSSRLQALHFVDDQILKLVEIMPPNRTREALGDTRRLTQYYASVRHDPEFWRQFNRQLNAQIETLEAELFALNESCAFALTN